MRASALFLLASSLSLVSVGCGSSSSSDGSTSTSTGGGAGASTSAGGAGGGQGGGAGNGGTPSAGGSSPGPGGASAGGVGGSTGGSAGGTTGGTGGSPAAGAGGVPNGGTGGGSAGEGGTSAGGSGGTSQSAITVGGDRPTKVHVPPSYDPATPAPLLVMLHGYGAGGVVEDVYLHLTAQADALGIVYVHPDGTTDASGKRFWNATDACCNFNGSTVDDEGYLMGIVDEIGTKLNIDQKRIFFMGHSNGGFMSYRMACHHSDRIAAISVLAGEMYTDVSTCAGASPVSVLHTQGTADMTILYGGGATAVGAPPYPSAETSVGDWVTIDGCAKPGDTSSAPLDLAVDLPGAETTVTKYATGCKSGSAVELWTITGGPHIPSFGPAYAPDMAMWLLAHPKP